MREKLSLSLDADLIRVIDKNMVRANYNNRSKFIEFALHNIFFGPRERLKFYEELQKKKARDLYELNKYVRELQEKIELLEDREAVLEIEKQDKDEKDGVKL